MEADIKEVLRQTADITVLDTDTGQRNLSLWMLSDNRQYVIEKVKEPFMKGLILLGNRFPKATYENVGHPNSKVLLAIRDAYIEHEQMQGVRREMFEVFFNVLIVIYDHDPFYRWRIDWLIEEIVEAVILNKWEGRPDNTPMPLWANPTRGHYVGRIFKDMIISHAWQRSN